MKDSKLSRRKGFIVAFLAATVIIGVSTMIYLHVSRLQDAPSPGYTQQVSAPEPTANQPQTDTPCPQGRPPHLLNLGGETVRICGDPVDGSVTAISALSITVKTDNDSLYTFAITNKTIITERGQPLTAGDIKIGSIASVVPADADAHQAGRILLNPRLSR